MQSFAVTAEAGSGSDPLQRALEELVVLRYISLFSVMRSGGAEDGSLKDTTVGPLF